MSKKSKFTGEQRRNYILQLLKNSSQPITGQKLADETGVSRQVIVTDIALLRTANEPIISTNSGYLYLQENESNQSYRRIVACKHSREQTKEELDMIVDCGVTVVNVIVEHPFYGDLTGSLMLKSRLEVEKFYNDLMENKFTLLAALTDGVHLHTLEADSLEKLDAATKALSEAGILILDDPRKNNNV